MLPVFNTASVDSIYKAKDLFFTPNIYPFWCCKEPSLNETVRNLLKSIVNHSTMYLSAGSSAHISNCCPAPLTTAATLEWALIAVLFS